MKNISEPVRAYRVGVGTGGTRKRPPTETATRQGDRIEALAVLPLENLSGDPEQEYFADGMTETLIGDLARIASLRVISRTSIMRYKGVRKPLPEIARELNVDAVVEGTVLRAGERVRRTSWPFTARWRRRWPAPWRPASRERKGSA
jgi:TolB-like protein